MAKNTQIIEVQTKGAEKSKKQLKGVSGGLKSMAKSAALAAGAYLGARGLLNVIKSSLDLFAEQQLAEVKLESALGKTSATLKKYASALQQTTRFGDELILQGMAQLAFFIKDEEQLKIATKATLDLASAKGMDLVQAADLVAKSVGSSTNALSRYGIAAEGAVGSEERLLSITDEIANLFGGQAEATTDSYQGAIDQLSNSFGDMQERIGQALAPTIRDLAVTFNDLLSVPVSEQITAEKNEFDSLMGVLNNVNTSEDLRHRTLTKINTLYGEYLPELLTEKSTIEDIAKAQKAATQQLLNRIAIELNREKIVELMKEQQSLELEEEKLVRQHTLAVAELGKEQDRQTQALEKAAEVRENFGTQSKFMVEGQVEEQEEMMLAGVGYEMYGDNVNSAQINVSNLKDSIDENKLAQVDLVSQMSETSESAIALGESFSSTGSGTDNLKNQITVVKDLDAVWANFIATRKSITKVEEKAERTGRKAIDDLQRTGKAFKKFKKISQAVAISETIFDTYKSAQAAYTNFQEFPAAKLNPPLFVALGIAAAAASIGSGMARVQQIKKAQYGADFITDGPQMMMVGEGAAGTREHVQVTPLDDPNIDGPQGQGITLNISGNVLHESFIEDNVIPQIREGLRLGENIGL
tara:strand:+ start:5806 stop:7731 length:1926 start_codon:yes stop_codon:yes gene_type:complete